jgi:predicted NAD/FAD-dependent oxidoreductase
LLSNVAPTLAPRGQHLWSVTVIPGHPLSGDVSAVASELAGWFGADAGELRHLDFVEVPYAVPQQPPGFAGRAAPWGELARGVHVAGDAAGPASIDAAMAGGEAVAENLIASATPG